MTDIFDYLKSRPYPGRGILIGCAPDGCAVFAYFIMGRSANSRNRVFVREGSGLTILPADASAVEDPSLIIYHPVCTVKNAAVVTNGDQTDTVTHALRLGKTFEEALLTRTFEPDAPNFTPRISGMIEYGAAGFTYALSILKAGDPEGRTALRQFFRYEAAPGTAHIIHTYAGGGAPLPSFSGEPVTVGLADGRADAFAQALWAALDEDNRVSLYARRTAPSGGAYTDALINRFTGKE